LIRGPEAIDGRPPYWLWLVGWNEIRPLDLKVERAAGNHHDGHLRFVFQKLRNRFFPCITFVARLLFGCDVFALEILVRPPCRPGVKQMDRFGKKLIAILC
jgi:hypothetical protein